MDILVIVVLLVLAIGITLKGRAKKKAANPNNKTGWHIEWSPGMPARPVTNGNGWYIDFSTDPASHLHYVPLYGPLPSLVGAKAITARFAITGGGFVPQEFPDGRPATVSILIQRKGDNWGAQGEFETYRQYSGNVVQLAAGEFTLTAALTHTHFGGIMGSHNEAAFAAVLADPSNIALVFGSAGGRGHGVYATQPSRFTLLGLEVS